jgi:hypothetical protein
MDISCHESVAAMDATEWDKATCHRPLLSHSYLTALEAVDSSPKFYVLFKEQGIPIACAYFSVKTYPTRSIFSRLLFQKGKRLECHHTVPADYEPMLKKLCDEVVLLRKYFKVSTAVVFFNERSKVMANYHYQPALVAEEAELDIHWDTFNAYLKALKSHYRSLIRKDLEKVREVSVEYSIFFDHYADEMASLHKSDSVAYLKALSGVDKAQAILLRLNGEIVGYAVFLLGRKSLTPVSVGVETRINEKVPLLFYIYYMLVKTAIEYRCDTLHLGSGAYTPKVRIGARLTPNIMYVKARTSLLSKIYAWLFRRPQQKVVSRDVWAHGG